jgi:hypothetical protein
VMRVSIVGWQTTAADVDRSADAILAAARCQLPGRPPSPATCSPPPGGSAARRPQDRAGA